MHLITTLGPKSADELGLILPHEHVFVDLRTWDSPGYAQADTADVIRLMAPELHKAKAAGVTALVECSTVGVGRRADILKAVSEAADFPLVIPTGVYREPWIPAWVHSAPEEALEQWMRGELLNHIDPTDVPAGWIKLSAGDDGLTATETKVLRAAGRAAGPVSATIGSHTMRGRVVQDQLEILQTCGFSAERFIWIHAHVEPDFDLNLAIAHRGAWIEYDAIGWEPTQDTFFIERILRMLDAGLGDRLLLSHDRGWYDPAQPGGGTPQSYSYLSETFLPKLVAAGVEPATIRKLTCENPFLAFAR